MKYLLLLCCVVTPFLLTAQRTKEVVVKFPNSKVVNERYFVQRHNRSLMHGWYERYDQRSVLRERGRYVSNRRVGDWKYFDDQGVLMRTDTYLHGRKRKEKRDSVELEFHEHGQVITGVNVFTNEPIDPVINLAIKYPYSARDGNIEGVVKVRMRLNDSCEVENLVVVKSLHKDCDEVVLEAMKEMARLLGVYHPAKCQGFDEVLEVPFRLN